jgi:hypothetical protein
MNWRKMGKGLAVSLGSWTIIVGALWLSQLVSIETAAKIGFLVIFLGPFLKDVWPHW